MKDRPVPMRPCPSCAVRVPGALALALALAGMITGALAQAAGAELSPSEYRVTPLCSEPAPGEYGCLGLRLAAREPLSVPAATRVRAPAAQEPAATAEATPELAQAAPEVGEGAPQSQESTPQRVEYKEPWPGSLSPQDLRSAYGLQSAHGATQQTLALVDANDDPNAEQDLRVYDEYFGLPACTTANGCFRKEKLGTPAVNRGWAQEISTDIEVAHGVCPSCRILLVEANSEHDNALKAAETRAEEDGANEISDSWGSPDAGVSASEDNASPFNHPGTVITAAAGDDGYLDWDSGESGFADYPAASPHVVAVGGTRLALTAGAAWQSEVVWNGDGAGGGGCAGALTAAPWQQSVAGWSSVGCGSRRASADVSADGDPYTGVAVYDSTPIREGGSEYVGWQTIGGTSVASPIIAAGFALAGGAQHEGGTVEYPARTLYENLAQNAWALHDVSSGSNGACTRGYGAKSGESECTLSEEGGSCTQQAICVARAGYDGPSGVGTPASVALFEAPALAALERPSEGSRPGESANSSRNANETAAGEGTAQAPAPGTPPSALLQRPRSIAAGPPSVSSIVLTPAAVSALARAHPRQLWITFKLNVAARVRVTLSLQLTVHKRHHWQRLGRTVTVKASEGADTAHVTVGGGLSKGRYQLTLAPIGGSPRSLVFVAR